MTFHSVTYESQSNRNHSLGGEHPQASKSLHLPGVGWATANTSSNVLNHPLIPFSGFTIPPISSLLFRTITDDDAIMSIGIAWAEQIAVLLDGTPLDNNIALIATATGDGGRVARDIFLSTGGDVGTALSALTGTTIGLDVEAQCSYLSETYMGLAHFCEFESHPPDTDAAGESRLQELFSLFDSSSASYQVGVDSLGEAIVVEQCGFAAVDPSGVVYITPNDIGVGPDQIPAAVTDNEPANFRAHPSVFYPSGRSQYVRGLTRQKVDTTALAAGSAGNALKIIRVDAAPTNSDWLTIIDGTPVIINVLHPAGSDFRRPRDIWTNVILPLINTGGANQQVSVYGSPTGTVGGALLTRLAYSEYWRCLPLTGTRITQTGGGG